MGARRTTLIGVGAGFGCAAAGCLAGAAVGHFAPDLLRSRLQAGADPGFSPRTVGLGLGVVGGFVAGAIVVALGLLVALAPDLRSWRPFARGPLRPSLSGLALIVAVAGLGFAGLKAPSYPWAVFWFALVALAVAAAALVALGQPPARRGFAAGFAAFGGTYLALSLLPESRLLLPTTALLSWLVPPFAWQTVPVNNGPSSTAFILNDGGGGAGSPNLLSTTLDSIDAAYAEFLWIGHMLAALVLGGVGGVVGDLLLARRRKRRSGRASGGG